MIRTGVSREIAAARIKILVGVLAGGNGNEQGYVWQVRLRQRLVLRAARRSQSIRVGPEI